MGSERLAGRATRRCLAARIGGRRPRAGGRPRRARRRAAPGGRRRRWPRRAGRAAIRSAANYTWTAVSKQAKESLDTLVREALPAARLAYPEGVERRPDAKLVLYAPDWSDEARWAATLNLWAEWFVDSDPITLALHCGDRDPDELAQTILGRLAALGCDPESLPDLMLCATAGRPQRHRRGRRRGARRSLRRGSSGARPPRASKWSPPTPTRSAACVPRSPTSRR